MVSGAFPPKEEGPCHRLAVTYGSNRIADCIGVTGAAEGSRYYGTGHPRHSYLGRVCNPLRQKEGGEATARTVPNQRRPGQEALYPDLKPSITGQELGWSHLKATSSYAPVAIPTGSMMIRVQSTQA